MPPSISNSTESSVGGEVFLVYPAKNMKGISPLSCFNDLTKNHCKKANALSAVVFPDALGPITACTSDKRIPITDVQYATSLGAFSSTRKSIVTSFLKE